MMGNSGRGDKRYRIIREMDTSDEYDGEKAVATSHEPPQAPPQPARQHSREHPAKARAVPAHAHHEIEEDSILDLRGEKWDASRKQSRRSTARPPQRQALRQRPARSKQPEESPARRSDEPRPPRQQPRSRIDEAPRPVEHPRSRAVIPDDAPLIEDDDLLGEPVVSGQNRETFFSRLAKPRKGASEKSMKSRAPASRAKRARVQRASRRATSVPLADDSYDAVSMESEERQSRVHRQRVQHAAAPSAPAHVKEYEERVDGPRHEPASSARAPAHRQHAAPAVEFEDDEVLEPIGAIDAVPASGEPAKKAVDGVRRDDRMGRAHTAPDARDAPAPAPHAEAPPEQVAEVSEEAIVDYDYDDMGGYDEYMSKPASRMSRRPVTASTAAHEGATQSSVPSKAPYHLPVGTDTPVYEEAEIETESDDEAYFDGPDSSAEPESYSDSGAYRESETETYPEPEPEQAETELYAEPKSYAESEPDAEQEAHIRPAGGHVEDVQPAHHARQSYDDEEPLGMPGASEQAPPRRAAAESAAVDESQYLPEEPYQYDEYYEAPADGAAPAEELCEEEQVYDDAPYPDDEGALREPYAPANESKDAFFDEAVEEVEESFDGTLVKKQPGIAKRAKTKSSSPALGKLFNRTKAKSTVLKSESESVPSKQAPAPRAERPAAPSLIKKKAAAQKGKRASPLSSRKSRPARSQQVNADGEPATDAPSFSTMLSSVTETLTRTLSGGKPGDEAVLEDELFEILETLDEPLDSSRPLVEFPELDTDQEEITRYPVYEPFAYIRIVFDKRAHLKKYHVVEPDLTNKEQKILNKLEQLLAISLEARMDELEINPDLYIKRVIEDLMKNYSMKMPEWTKQRLLYYAQRDFVGYGKMDALMRDPEIEDISCDGAALPLFLYHREYENIETNISFSDDEELDSFVIRLGQLCNRHISIANPVLDAALPDGSRLQATLAREVSAKGSTFTIRKFREDPFTPTDLLNFNTMSADMIAYLWLAVENGSSVIFAGGTASGKTTSLNATLLFIPPQMKIVSIEDTREINLPHPNWIPAITRAGFGEIVGGKQVGEINLYNLLENALRQRPEYIVVGEVRGPEAYVLFQAMATGHATYATMHADSVPSLIHRLRNAPINIPTNMLHSLDIINIQVQTRIGGKRVRRCKSITEIMGIDPNTNDILTNEVFRWNQTDDVFSGSSKSYVLDEIMLERNLSRAGIQAELDRRKEIIHWMRKRNMRSYLDVANIISAYYHDPDGAMERIRGDE